jgi:hypothetical protein
MTLDGRAGAGKSFTIEATQIAKAEGCDVVSVREFGWTDVAYGAFRQPLQSAPRQR